LGVAEEDGQAGRGEAVGRVLVQFRGIGGQLGLDARRVAEGHGLAKRQLGTAVDEELGDVRAAVVDGEENRGRRSRGSGEERAVAVEQGRGRGGVAFADRIDQGFVLAHDGVEVAGTLLTFSSWSKFVSTGCRPSTSVEAAAWPKFYPRWENDGSLASRGIVMG